MSVHWLFALVTIERKDKNKPARLFSDYDIVVDKANVPDGVELIEMV